MRPHLLCATLALLAPATLAAQSAEKPRLGLEIASTRWARSAHDDGTPETSLALYKPAMFTLRFTSHIGKVGIGLSVARSWADFGSSDNGNFTVVSEDEATLWEFSPEIRVAVLRTAGGGRLYLHGGVTVDRWTIKEVDPRTRFGVIAGATASGNLGGGWDVNLRIDGAASPSIFNDDDFVPGVTIDPTRRIQFGVGLAREL